MKIYLMDYVKEKNLGVIDFVPRKDERIVINNGSRDIEYKVYGVLYKPKSSLNEETNVYVLVDAVPLFYCNMLKEVKPN